MLPLSVFYQSLNFLSPFPQFFFRLIVLTFFFLNQQQEWQQPRTMLIPMIPPCKPLLMRCPSSCNDQCCGSYNFLQPRILPASSFLSSCLHQISIHVCLILL